MNYRNSYYLTNPWELISEIYREIKWFIQRGRRGYSDRDRWGMCGYLSGWMPGALREFIKYKVGYPDGATEEEWHAILEKIAVGFEAHNKIDDLELDDDLEEYKKKVDELLAIQKEGLELFAKWYNNLWD